MRFVKWIGAVAAVAVLCFVSYFLLDNSSNTQNIFADYFEPSELTITRSTDVEADIMMVKELYNTKKYDEALPLFKKIIDSDASTSNLRLAYGNTLLKCNKIPEARKQFNFIIRAKDPLYTDQARWYLALLKLKKGNLKGAIENLNLLVSDENSDFYTEAKALLVDLEDLK